MKEYRFDVNSERDERGNLLVHVATMQGLASLPVLFVLKSKNADINAKNKEGRTPLSIAAQMGEEKLVNVRAPHHPPGEEGGITCLSCDVPGPQVLTCVFGADMGLCDELHWTPLHYAAANNHPSTIQ